jgi:ribosomal protein L37AE/L43A
MSEKKKKTLQCPKCKSKNIEPVEPFDYIKQCKDCGEQFMTGIHN